MTEMRPTLFLMFALPLFVASASLVPSQAIAEGTATTAKALPPGFERVAGAPATETVDPSPLVVGAYAAFFVGMCGYLVFIARGQAKLAEEMAELHQRVARAEKKGA